MPSTKEQRRAYYLLHKDKMKEQSKQARKRRMLTHRDEILAKSREYYRKHRDERTADSRMRAQKQRKATIELLGGKCANPNCRHLNEDGTLGCKDERLLQIDHPNKDGHEERKYMSLSVMWRKVFESAVAGENKYRLLCAQCNWLHRFEDF